MLDQDRPFSLGVVDLDDPRDGDLGLFEGEPRRAQALTLHGGNRQTPGAQAEPDPDAAVGLKGGAGPGLLGQDVVRGHPEVVALALHADGKAPAGGQEPGLGDAPGHQVGYDHVLGGQHRPHGEEGARAQRGQEGQEEEAVLDEEDGVALDAQWRFR